MTTLDTVAAGVVLAAATGPLAVPAIRSLARFRAQKRVLDREIRELSAGTVRMRGRVRRDVEG